MSSEYQQGKDIGEIKARLESLSGTDDHHLRCGCKGRMGERASSQLTAENLRVLRLMRENATQIKNGIEDVFLSAGIKPQLAEKFLVAAFSIVDPDDTSASTPLTPWGPYIGACCSNGKYGVCFQIGCDPCA